MVPKEVLAHAAILRTLAKSKPGVLKKQLQNVSPNVIKVLKKISKNVYKGNVKLTKRQKERLTRHKRCLQELALNKTSLKRSKKLLQRGGFVSAILAPLAGVLLQPILKAITGGK